MNKKEQEIGEEYASSLADLNVNSKPLINMLTIVAEDNIENAKVIVQSVEDHINKVTINIHTFIGSFILSSSSSSLLSSVPRSVRNRWPFQYLCNGNDSLHSAKPTPRLTTAKVVASQLFGE